MTAYGRSTISLHDAIFVVEITSVNRKNLDLSITLPRDWLSIEVEIRRWLAELAKRGSIILKISRETAFSDNSLLNIDLNTFKELKKELSHIQSEIGLSNNISFEFLFEQAMKLKTKDFEIDAEDIQGPIKQGIESALKAWDKMRSKEGSHLHEDLKSRLNHVVQLLDKIEKLVPLTVKAFEEKLRKKLMESGFFQDGDFERICKEVLLFSDKIDTTEEMIRLRSHITQFLAEMKTGEAAIGKKLDFLMQEMHREANSLGVKCQDLEVIQLAVSIKSELEKIREQVQNIE